MIMKKENDLKNNDFKNNNFKKDKLKNYFDNEKNNISIIRIVSLVIFFIIIFNIIGGIIEIKNMEKYIMGNSNSYEILNDSKKELESVENTIKSKKINMGNVRKIFETIGVENIDSIQININSAMVIGKSNDMKTIEKLMKNKILKNSHVRRIEGGEKYTFEITSEE